MSRINNARPSLESMEPREVLSATPLQIASALTHSAEYYGQFVTAAYDEYLGRRPDTAGLAGWVGAMQAGLSDEQVEASFIGSAEYIHGHGGQGAGWVRGMYQDLLGRTPGQGEVDGWVSALGHGASPFQVAYGFAASAEREGLRARDDYFTYLGRSPSQAEVNGWVDAFGRGMSNEDIVAGFVGSPEFYTNAGGQYDVALWLMNAYRNVLGRVPSAAEVTSWVGHSPRILGTTTLPSVYVADGNNEVYRLAGARCQDLGQGALAPDGSFWFLGGPAGSTTALFRSAGGQMVQQGGSWTSLLGVASDGRVWVARGASAYSGNGSAWRAETSSAARALVQGTGLGARVVQYAQQFLGKRAPDGSRGECTDLVIAALQNAGARTTFDYGVSGGNADYVWGHLVADWYKWTYGSIGTEGGSVSALYPIRAGDIIQFRDVTLVSRTVRPDGLTWTSTFTYSHHSAVIEAVLGGGRYRILEQNWTGGSAEGRVVRRTEINLSDMTKGHYWIYQPVAK